ncbi:MAG: hypothetical protein VB115_14325 [Christensenellaceae bacterium]|nr:hypothetical protein [Christensenellaceae bacterium]
MSKRGPAKEKAILEEMKQRAGGDSRGLYVLWRFAPHLLPDKNIKTFDDLKSKYTAMKNCNEDDCKAWLYEKRSQDAIKVLHSRLHQNKMIEIYNSLCEKALGGDTQAFKAVKSIGDQMFGESSENSLDNILNRVEFDEEQEE